jgi:hypothetical protein
MRDSQLEKIWLVLISYKEILAKCSPSQHYRNECDHIDNAFNFIEQELEELSNYRQSTIKE